jgi:hypothetical protein
MEEDVAENFACPRTAGCRVGESMLILDPAGCHVDSRPSWHMLMPYLTASGVLGPERLAKVALVEILPDTLTRMIAAGGGGGGGGD